MTVPIPNPFRRPDEAATRQYAADRELAATFDDLLDVADDALAELRRLSVSSRDIGELRRARFAAEKTLLDAVHAAEAGKRSTAGVDSYGDRIAMRKARARTEVARWVRRERELRTRREMLKLRNATTPGTLVPAAVRVDSTGAYGPHVFGMEPLPGTLRAGVDLGAVLGDR